METAVDNEVQTQQAEVKKIQVKKFRVNLMNEWFDTVCPDGTPEERSSAINSLDINEFYQKMLEFDPNWSQKGNEKGIKLHFSWYKSNYKKIHDLPKRKVNSLKA